MALNESEQRISGLARKTFLTMWSYENPYYKRGKELCDVLIVFGSDVIVISDKLNEFGRHPEPDVNWRRWYKKAVAGSIRQLLGAKRRILSAPDDIFTDAEVSSPLPLRLPPIDKMRIHLLAIANGSEGAYKQFPERVSLRIDTRCYDENEPMTVGTYGSSGDFVHVISRTALDALFECFDTARDFIDYLERKEVALTSGNWIVHGEENLVAGYMLSQPGNRPFHIPVSSFPLESDIRTVPAGIWATYLSSNERQARREHRKYSYVIDNIIEHIAREYLGNRMIIGQEEPLSYHEEALRLIAAESRLGRQMIATALRSIMGEVAETFWSAIIESLDYPGLFYVWLIYPEPPAEWSDVDFERFILNEISKYTYVARSKFSDARRVFGICLPRMNCSRTSMVFRLLDGEDWTDEQQKLAEDISRCEHIFDNIQSSQQVSYR